MECVPKKDNMREGEVLNEFLKMMIPKKIEYDDVKSKTDFFKKLENNDSKIVHISCHGDKDSKKRFFMKMPRGNIYPDKFNEDAGLKGRNVVLTGCSLGRANFAKEFLEKTHAESLIAPMNNIYFHESARWCVNFYHHLSTRSSFSCSKSYDYMSNFRIPGGMKMWP